MTEWKLNNSNFFADCLLNSSLWMEHFSLVQSLSDKEISACSISVDGTFYCIVSQEDSCIKNVRMNHFNIAYFRLVYAYPETVTTNSRIRKLLLTKRFQEIVCCIVIDEVHMVSEW